MPPFRPVVVVLAVATIVEARSLPGGICGTGAHTDSDAGYRHLANRVRQGGASPAQMRAKLAAAAATNRDFGNVSVIDDAGGVVDSPNQFNLSGKTVTFVPTAPAAPAYRVQTTAASFDRAAYNSGTVLALKDDDSAQVYTGFAFPFFGKSYRVLWVNSDGNVTFGEADKSSLDRSAGRLNGGPPRIAPLFTDLNPETAAAGSGVRIQSSDTKLTITWQGIPTFVETGTGAAQSFQLRLSSDGRIEMAFDAANPPNAVTGISPGRSATGISAVSLSSVITDTFNSTVAEIFTDIAAIDMVALAQKFYATHEDSYDYIAVFNSVGIPAMSSALAYELTVRSQGSGFGDDPVSRGEEFGSPSRLKAMLNMGPLFYYPDDMAAPVPVRQPTGDTILSVLAHETGHLFLARVSVKDPNDPSALPMLGRSLVHWSFNFNADASYLEGSQITDLGAGSIPRFRTATPVQRYSALDQYLMGLRPKEEVSPTFLVTGSQYPASKPPQANVLIEGTRRDVTIDQVIAVAGRRVPDSTVAQRRFRMAFVLVTKAGQDPSTDAVAKVQAARQAFETFFSSGTGSRAFMDTGLRRAVQVSASPASGVLVGGKAKITVTLASPATSNTSFSVSEPGGLLSVPDLLLIPTGASSVSFTATGVRSGVAELSLQPASATYEAAYARVQVRPTSFGLTLKLITPEQTSVGTDGIAGPVQMKVLDENLLGYSGVSVTASVTKGQLEAATVTSDENGIALFRWRPGANAGTLQAAISNSGATPVTVTLNERPVTSSGAIVNGASFVPGITPGSFATLFGASLTGGVTGALAPPLPYGYSQVQVLVNGIAAQLSYVGDGQINFVVPWNVTGTSANIDIVNPNGQFSGYVAIVRPVSPGIFVLGNQLAAVLVSGSTTDTGSRPAKVGDVIEVYCTGLGPVTPSKNYPGLQETTSLPRIVIGGVDAQNVVAVLSPQFPGLYQVNAVVARGTPSGTQTMRIDVGTVSSNEVPVRIE